MSHRRILIFSINYYPNFVGGAEVAAKEITDRISDVQFDLIALKRGEADEEKIGNVNVHRISPLGISNPLSKFLYPFFAYKKALELHLRNNYDAVWAIMASYAGYAAYLFRNKHKDVPMILTIQEGENFGRRKLFKPLFRKIFQSADRIQSISKFLAEWSRDMGARCPVEVVPNGVDVQKFSAPISAETRKQVRDNFGFKDSDTVLVTASRLVEKNAVDDIITSLTFLDSSYKLLILGIGQLESELKVLTEKLGLADRVVFAGFVTHDDLPKYLQASDIFVRPSRTEGLGNSFIEAMAAGIPVIATSVGGITDFLIDGETGLFCEVDNPGSIAKRVEKLVKDQESREYIVDQGRKMVARTYEWKNIAAQMKSIFDSAKIKQ